MGIKVHSRRQEVQADLNRKREVLDDVAERLRDLAEVSSREPRAWPKADHIDSERSVTDARRRRQFGR